ncbi:MAG: ABC transporter ATP-binding protein [Clostridia bacterium]|jgi:peptide/nickel transport system ATP-binding protein
MPDIGKESNRILDVKSLKMYFPVEKGVFKKLIGYVRAVDGVSFYINKGETLGLVGESGCGKSTVGKTLLRCLDATDGSILYDLAGQGLVDITGMHRKELKVRGFMKEAQMIFQDPYSSLDPRMTVLDIISEPLVVNKVARGQEAKERVEQLMKVVGLDVKYLKRYPHAFSGGQRQRIGIARALSTNPRFIVADEPTSALDVSIQAQILNLLKDLQDEFGLTYLFISHDLGVIDHMCDRVAIMYLGSLVESGPKENIFANPLHPYTEALLKSVPIADPDIVSGLESAPGEIGNPMNPPSGCYFHPRCGFADGICKEEAPELRELYPKHFVACHYADVLALRGIATRRKSHA